MLINKNNFNNINTMYSNNSNINTIDCINYNYSCFNILIIIRIISSLLNIAFIIDNKKLRKIKITNLQSKNIEVQTDPQFLSILVNPNEEYLILTNNNE